MSVDASLKYRRALARAGLRAGGVKLAMLDRALRLVDLDEIDIEGDEVVGLADQIDELKDEWSELFTAPESEKHEPVDEGDEGEGKGEDESLLSGSTRTAVALLRSTGDREGAKQVIARSRRRPDSRTASQRQALHLLGRDGDLPPEAA